MASIMIIDNWLNRREQLGRLLEGAGHQVTGLGDAGEIAVFDASGIDLVILNLYPDAFRTWELYLSFKEKLPHLPVLVYLQHSVTALKSIRQIVASIVSDERKAPRKRGHVPAGAAAERQAKKGGRLPGMSTPAGASVHPPGR